ncbi:hypothetical protein QZH41_003106 [Actinostola sp. cb2023]|nr:hypothetical protein QZH41_003106 [Actinostola sp. cb2023]
MTAEQLTIMRSSYCYLQMETYKLELEDINRTPWSKNFILAPGLCTKAEKNADDLPSNPSSQSTQDASADNPILAQAALRMGGSNPQMPSTSRATASTKNAYVGSVLHICTGPEMIPGSEMIPGPEMIPKVVRLAPK